MKFEEQNLMQQLITQGNSQAFRKLFDIYYDKIFAFTFGFLKSRDDANDLTQEVFIKIWRRRERLAEVRNLDTYIFVITKNTIYDFFETRYSKISIDSVSDVDLVNDANPIDFLVEKELQENIEKVLQRMPTQRRRIFRMSREEGLTNNEIAERLNLSTKAIEYHLSLALKELRKTVCMAIILYLC